MPKHKNRHAQRGSIQQKRRKGRALLKSKSHRRILVDIYLSDISKNGVGLWLEANYPAHLGDEILLEFIIPNGKQIVCRGKIIRLNKASAFDIPLENPVHAGIEFIDIPKEYSKEIESKVQQIIIEKNIDSSIEALDLLLGEIGVSVGEVKNSLLRNWKTIVSIIIALSLGFWLIITSYNYGKTEWWKPKAKEWYKKTKK